MTSVTLYFFYIILLPNYISGLNFSDISKRSPLRKYTYQSNLVMWDILVFTKETLYESLN